MRHTSLAFKVLVFFTLSLFISCFSISRADEISSFVRNYSQIDYWTQYVYDHQASREKISMETARKIAHAAIVSSSNYGIKVSLILSVMATESGFDPHARSRSGARGLMQVIPHWHEKQIKGRNLYNIDTAVDVGTHIIKNYLVRAKGNENIALAYYCGYRGKSRWKYIATVHRNKNILIASVNDYKMENGDFDNIQSLQPEFASLNTDKENLDRIALAEPPKDIQVEPIKTQDDFSLNTTTPYTGADEYISVTHPVHTEQSQKSHLIPINLYKDLNMVPGDYIVTLVHPLPAPTYKDFHSLPVVQFKDLVHYAGNTQFNLRKSLELSS